MTEHDLYALVVAGLVVLLGGFAVRLLKEVRADKRRIQRNPEND